MTGLRKALAQPEQDPVIKNMTLACPSYLHGYTAPPKREQESWTPVEIGVDVTEEGTHVVGMYVLMPDVVRYVFYSKFHSAPKREWVGLTDQEIENLWNQHGSRFDYYSFSCDIEAKLKEKNT